jgi:hypothetical protein
MSRELLQDGVRLAITESWSESEIVAFCVEDSTLHVGTVSHLYDYGV